jgi:N-methylhydantoinase B
MGVTAMTVDPITREVIRGALAAAATEMNRTLVRTAHNPLLYEVQDFGLGIVGAEGRLWAEAPGIAGFISALSDTIDSGLARHGIDGYAEGDVLIVNDPFMTGTHISDTSVYAPIVADGVVVAFAIVTAHWADIGGKSPGGWAPDTTDVYQEGLCFSHQRLRRKGVRNEDLYSLIEANVRVPELVRGDLEAQEAACRRGIERVLDLCGRYGSATVMAAMDDVIAGTERAMRRKIAELPDGTYTAEIDLDSDGVDASSRPHVAVQVTVDGDRLRIGFDGTSQAAAGPINDPGARCDARCAVKGLLAPYDVGNQGHIDPIEFDIEPGLLVSPHRPAPVDSYGYVGVAIIELVIDALGSAIPERAPAGGYQIFGVDLWRSDPRDGEPFVFIDVHPGGAGARPNADGPSLIFVGDGDTRNTPVEVIEYRFPIRVERHALLHDLGGRGRFRGGPGVARDFRILESGVMLQFTNENVRDPIARGRQGGESGRPGELVIDPGTDHETIIRDRVTSYGPLPVGTILSARSGGGGGYGPVQPLPEDGTEDARPRAGG